MGCHARLPVALSNPPLCSRLLSLHTLSGAYRKTYCFSFALGYKRSEKKPQKSRMGEGELLPPPAGQLRECRRWACFVTAPKCSHLSKSLAIFDYLYYFISLSPLFSPLYAQTMLQRQPLKYCCRDIDLYVKLEMMEGGEFSAEKQRKTQTPDSQLLIP